jgi:hypothetical protein
MNLERTDADRKDSNFRRRVTFPGYSTRAQEKKSSGEKQKRYAASSWKFVEASVLESRDGGGDSLF